MRNICWEAESRVYQDISEVEFSSCTRSGSQGTRRMREKKRSCQAASGLQLLPAGATAPKACAHSSAGRVVMEKKLLKAAPSPSEITYHPSPCGLRASSTSRPPSFCSIISRPPARSRSLKTLRGRLSSSLCLTAALGQTLHQRITSLKSRSLPTRLH